MDVKQLKYFVTIVECAGFTQASRELNIAQPALSQQISRLEYEVGAPLLLRSPRGVTPTPKGLTLYRHAKFILRQIDQALVLTRETQTEVSGRVTIGLPPTTICQIGTEITEVMHRKYPGILLNIVEGLSGSLQGKARSGDLDLTILFTPSAVPGSQHSPLFREELFVVFPAERDLFPKSKINVAIRDLADVPLILPSQQHGLRRRIDIEFERLDMTITPLAEIDSLPILMRCLLRGMGATIKPHSAVNVFGPEHSGVWRFLPVKDVALSRVNYLYSAPDKETSPAIRVVAQEIRNVVCDQIKTGRWIGVEAIAAA